MTIGLNFLTVDDLYEKRWKGVDEERRKKTLRGIGF